MHTAYQLLTSGWALTSGFEKDRAAGELGASNRATTHKRACSRQPRRLYLRSLNIPVKGRGSSVPPLDHRLERGYTLDPALVLFKSLTVVFLIFYICRFDLAINPHNIVLARDGQ